MTLTPLLIQIQRWIMLPHVWRFVGFSSTAVGLFCYALSSSSKHLFGQWNLLKIFAYCIFSVIICHVILFAKVWQHSRSLRFKAHMAFLVLTATSLYSFFFDKAVNGKPDAYSLVSCASFAMMSLSLSRQTHCGFEVDMLYFFLGALIIQTMKTKLLLGMVGVGFSYSLIILRSSLDLPREADFLELHDHIVIQVDSQEVNPDRAATTTMPSDAITPENYAGRLQDNIVPDQVDSHSRQTDTDRAVLVTRLKASIELIRKNNRIPIRMLFKRVNRYLKADVNFSENKSEIAGLLLRTDPDLVLEMLPSETINVLHKTVKLMVAGGFEEECCQVYSSFRREFLQQWLSAFGIRELSIQDVENKTNLFLFTRIDSWTKAFNIALRTLFPNERRLCDRIFFGLSSSAMDHSFKEVCKDSTICLLNFANSFAIESPPLELSRSIVKVFETLGHVIPEMESLFSYQQNAPSFRNEAIIIQDRLRGAIRGIFTGMENLICRDSALAVIPDSGLHPITSFVADWLIYVSDVWDTLEQVFRECSIFGDREETPPSFSVLHAWIMELIESNSEARSKSYKDPALGYLFLMNNWWHIETMASIIQTPLAIDLNKKYRAKVQQNLEQYQRSTWSEVLDILKTDDNEPLTLDAAAELMKEKLHLFNVHFDEICSTQSTWFALDEHLRKEAIISLENFLLPAYGNFIGRFQDVVGKPTHDHVKYGMSEIQARLNCFLLGGNWQYQ